MQVRRDNSISLCMIVKDEEEYLPSCLGSVCRLVDEIIIVDTGSTDNTVRVAQRFGARIFHHPWGDDFSKHRNQSLSYATGGWILILDADEVIAERDIPRIKHVLETVSADGFFFTLRNYEEHSNLANMTMNPGDYDEGKGYPCFISRDLIRLFRNDSLITFSGRVHETVWPAILQAKKTAFRTGIPIHHYGKVRRDRISRKQEAYGALGMKRLAENPCDPTAYKVLSDQLLELGQPQKALDVANQGLALFPDMLELRFNRGLSLDRLHREPEAEEEYRWVVSLRPHHAGACHNLGQILLGRKEGERAARLLQRGIEAGIRHPAVFFLLGRALEACGEENKAFETYERVLELQSDYPDVRCSMAVILLNLHRQSEALALLEKEIEIGGNLAAAYYLLGEISLHLQDSECAGEFFMKVLTIDPGNTAARKRLERLGCDRGAFPH